MPPNWPRLTSMFSAELVSISNASSGRVEGEPAAEDAQHPMPRTPRRGVEVKI